MLPKERSLRTRRGDSIGVWAAVALVTLRLVQGIAFGGEWGGAILMAFEYAEPERRGFFASVPQVGPAVGTLMGNAAFLSVTLLPDEQFLAWGWRIPFVLSALLVGLGLIVRLKIAESPEFAVIKREGAEVKVPIATVLRDHLKPVLLVCGGFLGYGAFSIIALTYLVGYARNEHGVSSSVTLVAILATCLIQIPVILLGGHLSDRYGRRIIMTVGPLAAVLATFLLFWTVNTGEPWWIVSGYVIGMGVLFTSAYGAQPALFADSFDPSIRYTGMSLGYQMANVIGSGLMPLVATLLLRGTGSSYSIAVAIAVTLLISMFCLLQLVKIAAASSDREPSLAVTPSTAG
ncbi:MFS transporter [Rhodococcus sp. IEGM 1370]|uniref:MFS transporter n=1 Tax=Rhodococcus sp. IEGM 1370 TaxID=3082222 RepID=UPI0029542219|nr:MFS transporter [Rhodococcus sp. IEGM 1370]MDV8079574.1 MFS transporter [Rhodococcus sp. IEGM 1370]